MIFIYNIFGNPNYSLSEEFLEICKWMNNPTLQVKKTSSIC
jgi:hypothetical protein